MVKRKFLKKLIISMLLIAVLPIFIFGLISYYNVSKTFTEQTSETNLQSLDQTINAMEIVVNQIHDSSRQVVLDQSFSRFQDFPQGDYYEHIRGEFQQRDLPILHQYLENKNNAQKSIQLFMLSNEFIDSIYFYDAEKSIVLEFRSRRGTSRQFSFDEFYDKEWYPFLNQDQLSPLFMDPRNIEFDNQVNKQALTMIYRTQNHVHQFGNAFIINLDAQKVYQHIFSKLNNHMDSIYVLSESGDVIFHDRSEQSDAHISAILGEENHLDHPANAYVSQVDEEEVLITYSMSDVLGWTFVNVSELSSLYQSLSYLKQIIIYSGLLLFMFICGFAYFSSRHLYRPIRQLTTNVGKKWDSLTNEFSPNDELHFIENVMENTAVERDDLKKRVEESFPYYQQMFKYSLVRRGMHDLQEISRKSKYLQIEIDPQNLMLILVSFNNYRQADHDPKIDVLNHLRVMELIKTSHIINRKYFTVEIDENEVVIVINVRPEEIKTIFEIAQSLSMLFEQQLDISFTMGISRICKSIKELPRAYDEATEALRYQIIADDHKIIYIDDMVIDQHNVFISPTDKEDILIGYIKTGEADKAKQVFTQMIGDIKNSKIHYHQAQQVFMQLLTNIMKTLYSLGAEVNQIFRSELNPYHLLSQKITIEEIQLWFEEIIVQATDYIMKETETKDNDHVSKMIAIIERDIDQDLSLNRLSEELQLNPSYVSRLFKQKTGQSFVEYVTNEKIERSKKLLSQEKIKVKEVSEKMGYNNTYYFIKVFKQHTGLTPGEYKKVFGDK